MATSKQIQQLLNFSIINIDKPEGPTSFSVSDFVRKTLREFGVTKTSHFGTLDPKVTGVLPIAINRACKLTGFFLGSNKEYVGILRIHKPQEMKTLQEIIDKNFIGVITQLPPKKSAVKREERQREIHEFKLLESSKDKKDFLFKTTVQGGTYIRKLCSDLGELKEVQGAHMLELRRIRAGIFKEDSKEFPLTNLYELKEALEEYKQGKEQNLRTLLIPAEEAIKKILPVVQVKAEAEKKLLTGKPLFKQDLETNQKIPKEETFAIFSKDRFIEIAKREQPKNDIDKNKDIIAKSLFVFN